MLRNARIPIAMAVFASAIVGCAGSTSTASSSVAPETSADRPATTQPTVSTTAAPTPTTAPAPTTPPTAISEITVTGVVIDVVGGLAGIDSFTLRLPDGTDLELTPTEDLLFDDVAPISHLRDHLVSGAPVTATYLESDREVPVVVAVGDAEGGHSHDD